MLLIIIFFVDAMKMFIAIIMFAIFFVGMIEVDAGHHHLEVVHDVDSFKKKQVILVLSLLFHVLQWRLGLVYFIYTLDTIMSLQELHGNIFLTLANFGDHVLHHLFPTLDHELQPELYDDFFKTMIEFKAECYL